MAKRKRCTQEFKQETVRPGRRPRANARLLELKHEDSDEVLGARVYATRCAKPVSAAVTTGWPG